MMRMSKKIYQRPETQSQVGTCCQILESSYVPVGGTGSFDVKEDSDWTDDWDENDD